MSNINQNTVTLVNAGGMKREYKEIPDLWHIAQTIQDVPEMHEHLGGAAADLILEVWHMAHDLKDAITGERGAHIIEGGDQLAEPLPTLLRDAAKTLGTHDPDEVMPLIEEQLNHDQYRAAHGFLSWLNQNDFTFGHNIQEVYAAYRSGDTSGLRTATEIRGSRGIGS